MAIPKKPQAQAPDIDSFIGGAKASQAERQHSSAATEPGKKMFSVRLDPLTVRKIKIWAGLAEKTKEEISQEAFDLYFSDKDIPTPK